MNVGDVNSFQNLRERTVIKTTCRKALSGSQPSMKMNKCLDSPLVSSWDRNWPSVRYRSFGSGEDRRLHGAKISSEPGSRVWRIRGLPSYRHVRFGQCADRANLAWSFAATCGRPAFRVNWPYSRGVLRFAIGKWRRPAGDRVGRCRSISL